MTSTPLLDILTGIRRTLEYENIELRDIVRVEVHTHKTLMATRDGKIHKLKWEIEH